MVDEVHHHRDAERVREQDELLTDVVAHVARVGQELNALEPLGLGEVDLLDERVKVLDEGKHDAPEPRLGRALYPAKDFGRDVVFGRGIPSGGDGVFDAIHVASNEHHYRNGTS